MQQWPAAITQPHPVSDLAVVTDVRAEESIWTWGNAKYLVALPAFAPRPAIIVACTLRTL